MTRIEGNWIGAAATQAVFDALQADGHRAYFVGGCVRNALLEQPVKDVDIATDALPEDVMRLAEAAGLRPVPTGIDHGTVTVVSGGEGYEVTTFRQDVETDGRRAVVAYSSEMRDDALRRDFTMNALYADRTGAVVDPLGSGLADLRAGCVRFIEDAAARIREDYLRILRFFRFHAWYGDPDRGIDAEVLAAIAGLIEGLDALSRERIGHEMRRLLEAPDPAPSLAAMGATGVLMHVLPGADPRFVPALIHLENAARVPPDAMRRLAALGGADASARLRLSKADARRLEQLSSGLPDRELAWRHGAAIALDAALVRQACLGAPLPDGLAEALSEAEAQVFPVTAADLMPELQGAELGAALKRLESVWLASDFRMAKEQLLATL